MSEIRDSEDLLETRLDVFCRSTISLKQFIIITIVIIKHPNINFIIEKEKDVCLPFLDVNIFCENEKFATNVYRKKTFSGVYINIKSFIPEKYNIVLIKSLLFRCFRLCSDVIRFDHEIHKFKSTFYKNSYQRDSVDKCIKEFLDKILTPKFVVRTEKGHSNIPTIFR